MKDIGYIDTHAHLWSNDYLEDLKAAGSPDVKIAQNINAGITTRELEERIKMMDNAKVQYQVLSATPQSPQWGSPQEALNLARKINDLYADIINDYPDRFLAYGAVPLPNIPEAIQEGTRAIKELGFEGIAVNTLIQNEISLADERFAPFFEAMNELKATIYIHPTGCGANTNMINDYGLEWVVGAPIEDTIAPLQLLKKNFPKKYPNLRFHVAHLGGALPFFMQRIEDNYSDWAAFDESPTQNLRSRFWYDTANFHEPSLLCANQSLGATQLMLGSDFPYFQNEKYTRAVTYVENSALHDEDKKRILANNAIGFYNL